MQVFVFSIKFDIHLPTNCLSRFAFENHWFIIHFIIDTYIDIKMDLHKLSNLLKNKSSFDVFY